jgi:hypothetical protein
MSDVDVPAVGRVDQKWVIVGGTAVAVIVGVAWWRHRQAAASAVPVVDPATGTDSTDPTYHNPNPVTSGAGSDAQLPPANDQEWTARVMASLSWFEPGYLGNILGKYLGRQPLSLEEAAVVRVAWATDGKPPSNTPIVLSTDTSTPGGGTTTPPPPEGKLSAPTGLYGGSGMFNRVNGKLVNNYIDWGWQPVDGADHYHWQERSAFGGQSGDVKTPGLHETGLMAPNADHTLTVWAVDVHGNRSGPATTVVHTHDNSY